jgi:ankyrin repeat protein
MYVADMITQYADMPAEELNALLQKIVPILQAKGADINAQNNNGETLLIKIAKTKQPVFATVLSTLIDLGANAGKKDQYGKTAADYAR